MENQFLSLTEGFTIQYQLVQGLNRTTIIFLHDALGCIKTWRDFPEALAAQTNCGYLVYDRLGYGSSSKDPNALNRDKNYLEREADLLLRILEELKIKSPILFGHSDGGSIGLIAAAKSNGNIRGILTEAAHIFVENLTLQGIWRAKENYLKGKLRAKLLKYHGSKTDDVFRSWADTWLSKNFQDWSIESFLPKINCPCLILQGENDEYGTLRQVEGIKQGVNGPVVDVILKNVGHTPHKEDREHVLDLAARFINKQF